MLPEFQWPKWRLMSNNTPCGCAGSETFYTTRRGSRQAARLKLIIVNLHNDNNIIIIFITVTTLSSQCATVSTPVALTIFHSAPVPCQRL